MVRKIALALGCAAMLCGMAPADPQPETVKRTGRWVINYDAEGCHLIGEFGAGEDRMLIRFTRFQPSDRFDFLLFGKRFASKEARKPAQLNFGLNDKPFPEEAWYGEAGELPVAFMSSVRLDGWAPREGGEIGPSISTAQEAAVTGVTVLLKGKDPVRLEFGSLAKPFGQMRDCTANLLRQWGYDPDVQASLSHPLLPASPPQSWVTNNDYPMGAVRNGKNA